MHLYSRVEKPVRTSKFILLRRFICAFRSLCLNCVKIKIWRQFSDQDLINTHIFNYKRIFIKTIFYWIFSHVLYPSLLSIVPIIPMNLLSVYFGHLMRNYKCSIVLLLCFVGKTFFVWMISHLYRPFFICDLRTPVVCVLIIDG